MKKNSSILTAIACLAMLGTGAFDASATQLSIDGKMAVLDSITGTYLCPTTIVNFGQDLEAEVTLGDADPASTVTINGTTLHSGDSYTFSDIKGSKNWTIEMPDGDTTVTRNITFTYTPILMLTGTFGNDYTNGTVQLLDPDEYADEPMLARVKWRGGVTNLGNRHKRNYHIKFIDENGEKKDRRLLGLRKDNSWIMDAGQIDFLRVRNRVNTELWNSFASKPYYADLEPKAKSGVDGHLVEVMLNGHYMGVYALTEAMDRKTMKLKQWDQETGEIHGQLWKTSKVTSSTSFNVFTPYNNNLPEWAGFETKYPDMEELATTDYKALGDAVSLGDTASVADRNRMYPTTFDMPVMIDYEILEQITLGIDNYSKNIYWFTYDTQQSSMLSLGVWDLDTSMGGNWSTADFHPATVSPTRKYNVPNAVFSPILKPTSRFYKQSIRRYHQLRQGPLATDSIIARYVNMVDYMKQCGAMQREENRWSHDSDISGRELNIESELAYVVDWIKKRMDYLDNNRYIIPIEGDVNADRTIDVNDINMIIDATIKDGYLGNAGADTNDDQVVDISDINFTLNLLLNKK